jgi:hypothetical protein
MKKPKIKSAPPEPPFGLNMPFDEALKRFIATDPEELEANVKRSKKKKPPGGKKKNPSDGKVKSKSQNVVSLRDTRIRKRNYGR